MTAAPYICWIALFLLITDRRRLLEYFLPLIAAVGFMGLAGITVRSSIALIFAVALGIVVGWVQRMQLDSGMQSSTLIQ